MGIFSFLKRRPKAQPVSDPVLIELRIPRVNEPPLTADNLRGQLFDAAAAGDDEKLCALCQKHEKSIFQQGMLWTDVPPEIRASPRLLHWYANGLRAIARFCSDRLGKPELMEQVQQFDSLPQMRENDPETIEKPRRS
jgi:hypothetical protein